MQTIERKKKTANREKRVGIYIYLYIDGDGEVVAFRLVIMAHKRRFDCANRHNYDSLLRESKGGSSQHRGDSRYKLRPATTRKSIAAEEK